MTVGLLVASTKLSTGMDFVPMEDNSEFQVFTKAPVGTSLEEMKKKMSPMLEKMKKDKNIEYSVLSIGYNSAKEIHKAKIYAKLKPVAEKSISQEDVVQKYDDTFKTIKDMVITVEEVAPFDTGGSNAPVQIVVTGHDLDVLDKTTQKLMDLLKETKGVVGIDRDYESGKPEIK